MGRVLNRAVLTGGVVYPVGTAEADVDGEVPGEFWTGGDSGSGYESRTVKELEADVASRNEGRDDSDQVKPDSGKKADLVAALEADDAKK